MPSGAIEITPGRVLVEEESVTTSKLNDLGNPTGRLAAESVTERELADEAFGGGKFQDDTLGPEKLKTSNLSDGLYALRVNGGVGSWEEIDLDALGLPIGFGGLWLSNTAPSGYLLWQGQELSRSNYPVLSAFCVALGGDYAGNGSTTFKLPNMRRRIPLGKGLTDGLGDEGGAEEVTLGIDDIPAHSHNVRNGAGGDQTNPLTNLNGFSGMDNAGTYDSFADIVQQVGGGQPHENMPPYLVINWISRAV